MATQAQKNAVAKLHKLSNSSDITATYGNGGYDIAYPDPYELAAAIAVGGSPASVLSVVVTGLTTPSAGTPTTEAYTAVVSFTDAIGNEDSTVTWSIADITGTGTYSISADGQIDYSVNSVNGDTFNVVATSDFDGTTFGTLLITVGL